MVVGYSDSTLPRNVASCCGCTFLLHAEWFIKWGQLPGWRAACTGINRTQCGEKNALCRTVSYGWVVGLWML